MKNTSDTIGNWTRALPACSSVPYRNAPPRAPHTELRGIFLTIRLTTPCFAFLCLTRLIFGLFKTKILRLVLYGCETWCMTLRQESRWTALITGCWRRYMDLRGMDKQWNGENYVMRSFVTCIPCQIIRGLYSIVRRRRMRWGRARGMCRGKRETHARFLWGNLQERGSLLDRFSAQSLLRVECTISESCQLRCGCRFCVFGRFEVLI
jgi:hypothetical protein